MSNEEFQQRMEFIVEHQAQFAANIQAHDERLARLEENVAQIAEHVVQLDGVVNRLAAVTLAGFKDVNAKIDALVDSQIRLTESQDRLTEAQTRTEAKQALTDEALRTLIATVERHISEGRNGG